MLAGQRSSPSPSPSRTTSLGSKISAFGARLSRTMNSADDSHQRKERGSNSPIPSKTRDDTERSISRGREAFSSTGRGGLGNIRPASSSRDTTPELSADDFSPTRGRERILNPSQVFSTGRGGAGNVRSPSCDPAAVDVAEQEIIKEYVSAHENALYSSGRGGIGNIHRPCSRDPANVYSSGRGGAGNVYPGDGIIAQAIDEDDRRRFASKQNGHHSPGYGGAANITLAPVSAIE